MPMFSYIHSNIHIHLWQKKIFKNKSKKWNGIALAEQPQHAPGCEGPFIAACTFNYYYYCFYLLLHKCQRIYSLSDGLVPTLCKIRTLQSRRVSPECFLFQSYFDLFIYF